ncbi:MAG TPA: phospholipase D-like domain-containing protein [Bacteroidota bacterium]|nr:phospholipase D-like domain-containing protein [Bacteroidota bacterium]
MERQMTRGVALWMLLLGTAMAACGQAAGHPDFEIVESIPIETVLDNPDVRNTQEVWLEMINGARSSLDIEEFYISNKQGEPLDDIIHALSRAADRGVSERIIVDSRMYKTYPETADLLGKQKNTALRVIDFGKLAGGVQHSKYFTVDGREVFLGSQNFDWRALKHIHELGVRIRDAEIVRVYGDIFNLDWSLAGPGGTVDGLLKRVHYQTPFLLIEAANDTIALTPTASPKGLVPDSTLWDETQIVRLINRAGSEVMCQFLTYSPVGRNKSYYPELENALRSAAARGVKVKMIVSDWSKEHPIEEYLKSLSVVPNIEVKFSVIPEWSGGYIPFARVEHCKYLVIDSSSCWIGTSNWEKSYFYNTRNVGIVVKNRNITGILRRIFLKGWDGPYTEKVKPELDYQARRHGE